MAPPARQGASFEKYGGPDARSVVDGIMLYVENDSFHSENVSRFGFRVLRKWIKEPRRERISTNLAHPAVEKALAVIVKKGPVQILGGH